jgi:hypothetical protein
MLSDIKLFYFGYLSSGHTVYRLHLQGPRISQTRNQREAGRKQRRLLHAGFLLGLFDVDESDMFLRNVFCLSADYVTLYARK